MSAPLVRTRSRIVSHTPAARAKFHGTILSARCSRRLSPSALSASDCSTRLTIERTLVSFAAARTRT